MSGGLIYPYCATLTMGDKEERSGDEEYPFVGTSPREPPHCIQSAHGDSTLTEQREIYWFPDSFQGGRNADTCLNKRKSAK